MDGRGRTDGRTEDSGGDATGGALNNGVNENWTLGGRSDADGRTGGEGGRRARAAKLHFFKRPMHPSLAAGAKPALSVVTVEIGYYD